MDYCLNFHRKTFDKGEFQEVIIKYNEENLHVVDFAKEQITQTMRLIVDMTEFEGDLNSQLATLIMVSREHLRVAVRLSLSQVAFAQELMENNIPYFFTKIAETWDELLSLVYAGAKDVYIGSELGFDIAHVAAVCHSRGINVRVYANVAQTSAPLKNMDTITAFFIRPEDVPLYEKHGVDVIEFFGPLDRQNVLFKIYNENQWLGKLSDIIIGLHTDIQNTAIAPRFAEKRVQCQKKCNYTRCEICPNVEKFARTLETSGYRFKSPRGEE